MLSVEGEKLVLENQKLVYYVAKKYLYKGIETEDLYSIGMLGLTRAAYEYRPQKGVTFSSFAVPAIENEIKTELKRGNAKKRKAVVVSLDSKIKRKDNADESENSMLNNIPDLNVNVQEMAESDDNVEKSLTFILNERGIISIAYILELLGFTCRKSAGILKVSHTQATILANRCKIGIKEYLRSGEECEVGLKVMVTQNRYMIIFSTNNLKDFKRVLPKIIQSEEIFEFKVSASSEKAVIVLPRDERGLAFMAILINELEEYNLKLVNLLSKGKDVEVMKVEKADKNAVVHKSNKRKKVEFSNIKRYMKEKRLFTTSELVANFPGYEKSSICSLVWNLKREGVIKLSRSNGEYKWIE